MRLVRASMATLALSVATAGYAQSMKFVPPRLLAAELAVLPAPTVVGGGEVLVEATVGRDGVLRRPIIVRGTPPYTQMVLDAIATWRFAPARTVGADGVEAPVEMPVAIAAAYRPPILMNAPTIGEPPKEWSKPSGDAAYPLSITMPDYPPQARDGGVVLFEVSLNEKGGVIDTRGVASTGGFESASRAALATWSFKGASYRARPVPSTAYVLFGFREPVVGSLPAPRPPSQPPFPPDFTPKP